MTAIAVLVDPPREGLVYETLHDHTPLSADEAKSLYRAAVLDTIGAVQDSGGTLIVNYRDEDTLPPEGRDGDARAEIDALLADGDHEDVRREVQVGSTPAARVGNTITHLLERESERTAAVVWPRAPLLTRAHIDEAAMKLRRHETVLGPSTAGRVAYAGFAEPIDFEGALEHPALETLSAHAKDAGCSCDFLSSVPDVTVPAGLAETVATVRARDRSGLAVPERTAREIERLGLRVAGNGVRVER